MYKSKYVYQHHVTQPTNKRKNAFRFCWFSGITPSHSPQSNRDFLMDIFWKTISTYILIAWFGCRASLHDNQQFKNAIDPANNIIETKKKSFQNKQKMILIYTYKSFKSPSNILWGQPIWVNSKDAIQNIQFKKEVFFFV